MKFTLKWLKEFLDTDASIETIANTLNSIGFEVEEIIDRSSELAVFEVARILMAEKHPSADKLQICNVLTKDGERQIVCGAPNARANINVVLAPVGAIIPNGKFAIKEAEIRGVKSIGMLCSLEELLITGASEGIIELPADAKVGEKALEYFGLDDPVVDISVTPNRGDALGVYGIARDLAAAGIGLLKPFDITQDSRIIHTETKDCSLFALCEISGVANKESPMWLKNYLNNIDVGSISAVVDITNYICHSFGRPMHAYDRSKISGDLKVSRAKAGEIFSSLSNKEYILSQSDIVIRDDRNIQSLAGIIGGILSACSGDTDSILLEAAIFDKDSIMRTGRRLGVETDARYRMERHTDPMMVVPAMRAAIKMISEICGGGSAGDIKIIGKPPEIINRHDPISLTTNDIKTSLGVEISLEDSTRILESLGFKVEFLKDGIEVLPPSWRYDVAIKEDLIEEIVRIYGFDNIPAIPIESNIEFRLMKQFLGRSILAKRAMASCGFDEVVTWSFMNSKTAMEFTALQDELTLQNPISKELNYMRPSIIPNLLEIIAKNHARSVYDFAIFEVGPIFEGTHVEEEKQYISALISGDIDANIHSGFRKADIFDIKAVFEIVLRELGFAMSKMTLVTDNLPTYLHPNRSAFVTLGKICIGYFGEIHPNILKQYDIEQQIVGFEMNLSALPDTRLKYGKREEFIPSIFQPVSRDFAFVMDQQEKVGPIVHFISNIDKKLIKAVEIFDIYMGDKIDKNHKSVAVKVILQSDEQTLSEIDLSKIQEDIIKKVTAKYNCSLRI